MAERERESALFFYSPIGWHLARAQRACEGTEKGGGRRGIQIAGETSLQSAHSTIQVVCLHTQVKK